MKHAKIATDPPSHLALPQAYRVWKKDSEQRLLDHHRLFDSPGDENSFGTDNLPPISLQYTGFGHFLDIFRGKKDVPGIQHVSSDLLPAVDHFAKEMSLIYPDELNRRSRGVIALSDIFSARTDNLSLVIFPTPVSDRGNSDKVIFRGPHHAVSCVVEFKNEPADVTSMPYLEMTSYFAHSVRKAILQHPAPNLLINHWNFPCLGLTIIGMLYIMIAFYALLTITYCNRPLYHFLCYGLFR